MNETKKERRKRCRIEAKTDRLTSLAVKVAKHRNSVGKNPVKNAADLRRMKIPTTPWWMRFIVGILGTAALGLGIFAIQSGETNGAIIGIILIVCALVILGVAIYGNRQTLDHVFRATETKVADAALDAIIDALF